VGFISAGYLLGEGLETSIDRYLTPVVALIVALSLSPLFFELLKKRRGG
jgi:membrane-associated protein